MRVLLRVFIDLNGDGDFADAGEDVSQHVRAASWFLGWRTQYQDVADTPTATITLNNAGRIFSPEVPGSIFNANVALQKAVYLACDNGGVLTPLWRGWINQVEVTPGEWTGDRSVTLYAVGHKHYLDEAEIILPLQENRRADEVIEAVFTATVQPSSKLLDVGESVFAYAGDTFDTYSTAWAAIVAAVEAERGRYWYTRNGQARLWNRNRVTGTIVLDVATMPFQSITYSYAQDVINDVAVTAYPRLLSATNNEVLWTRQGPLTIPPGGSRSLRAAYNDGTGATVAGRNVQTPTTGAGTLAFTGGTVVVSAFSANARSADITLTNTGGEDATVGTLVIRGQKLTALNTEQVTAQHAGSIAAYGRRLRTFDLRLLSSIDFAKNIAEYELFRQALPRGVVNTLTVRGPAGDIEPAVLVVSVMSRVSVADYQTGHTGTYWVIGEEHRWSASPAVWETTYTLESADTTAFWLVGVTGRSELGITTILGL